MADTRLLEALEANLALLREVGLRYDVATDARRVDDSYDNTVSCPEDVARICGDMLPLVQEQMRVLLLNTKNNVVAAVTVYQGTVNSASTRSAEILRPAIMANVPAFIMVHNHPSGDTVPSSADLAVTRKLLKAAAVMDIEVFDHIIVARNSGPYSMKKRGVGGFFGG